MAKVHWSPEACRDTIKNYHTMTLSEMKGFTKGFQWENFIKQWQLSRKQLSEIFVEKDTAAETPVSTLQDYLRFHYLSDQALYLSHNFVDARFNFYSRKLNGVKKTADTQRART